MPDKSKEIDNLHDQYSEKRIFFHRFAKFSCGRGKNAVLLPRHLRRFLIQVSFRVPV
jgi:hypothetical protein